MQPALLGNRSRAVPLRDTMGAARPLPEHCPGLVPSVYVVLPTRTLCAPLFVFHGCFHSVLPALLVRNINQRRVFLRAQKQTLTKDGLGSRAAVSYELAGRRKSDDGQSGAFTVTQRQSWVGWLGLWEATVND